LDRENYGVGYANAWEACWRFSPPGTTPASRPNRGDWLMPTLYDLQKFSDNYQDIIDVLTAISNKAGSTVLDSTAITGSLKVATEIDEEHHYFLTYTDGSVDYYSKKAI
jgi:hypothetical protein